MSSVSREVLDEEGGLYRLPIDIDAHGHDVLTHYRYDDALDEGKFDRFCGHIINRLGICHYNLTFFHHALHESVETIARELIPA